MPVAVNVHPKDEKPKVYVKVIFGKPCVFISWGDTEATLYLSEKQAQNLVTEIEFALEDWNDPLREEVGQGRKEEKDVAF